METYDVLVFSAHPDDAEMAMGGSMVALVQSGKSLMHVSLTRGEAGTFGTIDTRAHEFRRAAETIGCDSLMLEFEDTGIENNRQSRSVIARLVQKYRPKIVFAPYHTNQAGELGGVAHLDHAAAGSLVRDAVKIARLTRALPDSRPHSIKKLFFYMLPNAVPPRIIVDVTTQMAQARRAIEAHSSQLGIAWEKVSIMDLLLAKRAALGADIGVAFAEGFITDLPLVFEAQHFFEL